MDVCRTEISKSFLSVPPPVKLLPAPYSLLPPFVPLSLLPSLPPLFSLHPHTHFCNLYLETSPPSLPSSLPLFLLSIPPSLPPSSPLPPPTHSPLHKINLYKGRFEASESFLRVSPHLNSLVLKLIHPNLQGETKKKYI